MSNCVNTQVSSVTNQVKFQLTHYLNFSQNMKINFVHVVYIVIYAVGYKKHLNVMCNEV